MDWNLLMLGLTGGFTLGLIFTGGRNIGREQSIRNQAFRDVARGESHAAIMVKLYEIEWKMEQEAEQRQKRAWLAHQRRSTEAVNTGGGQNESIR